MHDALTQHASRTTVHTRSRQNAQVVTDNKVVVIVPSSPVVVTCTSGTLVVVTLLQG